MSHQYKDFEPKWVNEKFPENSYRSVFKWGDAARIKPPKESLYKLLKEKFNLTDDYFKEYKEDNGYDEVAYDITVKLTSAQLDALRAIVGDEFLRTDNYARLSVAYGKTMYDILRLRNKRVENVPDAVLYPDSKKQIEDIVAFCAKEKIPVYVYGGGSSVTRGVECVKGGISLDMRLRFNKVISFNEI
ncbi:MAG: FAD-binding protein, partial [Oscillospiraceae bacterium]